jgi:hypothetical protein
VGVSVMEILTTVHHGVLSEKHRKQINDFVRDNNEKLICISLNRKYKPKSTSQRGYYWGVMLPSIFNGAQGTDMEYDDLGHVHEEMKKRFLTIVPMRADGTLMTEKVLSTEDLNTRETEEYYEQIRRFWSTRGVYIPLPNEVEQVFMELV